MEREQEVRLPVSTDAVLLRRADYRGGTPAERAKKSKSERKERKAKAATLKLSDRRPLKPDLSTSSSASAPTSPTLPSELSEEDAESGSSKRKKKTKRGSSLKKREKKEKDDVEEDEAKRKEKEERKKKKEEKTKKKEKKEKKEKTKKRSAKAPFAATLPNPHDLPSARARALAASGLGWSDLPSSAILPAAGGGLGTLEDVEEWEQTREEASVCTISHFKLSLSSSAGGPEDEGLPLPDVVLSSEEDAKKLRAEVEDEDDEDGDEDDLVEEEEEASIEDDEDGGAAGEEKKGEESQKEERAKRKEADVSSESIDGSESGASSLNNSDAKFDPMKARLTKGLSQLKSLQSMEPLNVWRSMNKLGLASINKKTPEEEENEQRSVRKKKTELLWQELIDTEVTYVNNLDTIIQEFMMPLTAKANEPKAFLKPEQVELIFGRVAPLYAVHKELLKEFKRAESGACTFSDAFLTFMPFLKVYTTYVNKHPAAIELLIKRQRSSSRFKKFLDEVLNKTGMDVESFLILPIQRLPRYELIINDLLRQSMMTSAPGEHQKLQRLLKSIKEINTAVVENRKREESAERMYSIYASLVFPSKQKEQDVFDETIRVFKKEGMLDVCLPPSRKFVTRCFVLFTDILICTVKKGQAMKFEYFFKLSNIVPHSAGKDISFLFDDDRVFALSDRKSSGSSSGRRTGPNGTKSKNDNVLFLRASSSAEKQAWVSELEQLCAQAYKESQKKARRSITVPNLKDLTDEPTSNDAKEEKEEPKEPPKEQKKSRRLSLRPHQAALLSSLNISPKSKSSKTHTMG